MIYKLFFAFFIIVVLGSCESKIVVNEMTNLPEAWNKNHVLEYQIPSLDSLSKYNIFFHTRNTNEYPFNNIFLIASIEFPHGKVITDTLEYRMANSDGSWLGNGVGSIKESKLWFKENIVFFEEGVYKLSISHAVRNYGEVHGLSDLKGLTEVGYSIEEATQQ